ncbi:hypothetical protein BC826DRAFT_1185067 [Russula brevipes]|nr:hypothetical protein BC826DRAFT_1185067 [Russula brevipes]
MPYTMSSHPTPLPPEVSSSTSPSSSDSTSARQNNLALSERPLNAPMLDLRRRGPAHSKSARRLDQARACTQSTRPVDAPRNRACPGKTVRTMPNAGRPALRAALSFLLTTNLSDSHFCDVLSALQALARAAHTTRRVPYNPRKSRTSPGVVAALDEPSHAQPTARSPGVAERRAATTAGAQPTQSDMRARSRRCDPAILVLRAWVASPRSTCNALFIVLLMSCGTQSRRIFFLFSSPSSAATHPCASRSHQAAVQRRVLDVRAAGHARRHSTEHKHGAAPLGPRGAAPNPTGLTLLVGQETIFEVPGSVCWRATSDHAWPSALSLPGAPRSRPPPLGYLQEKGYSALIKTPA